VAFTDLLVFHLVFRKTLTVDGLVRRVTEVISREKMFCAVVILDASSIMLFPVLPQTTPAPGLEKLVTVGFGQALALLYDILPE